MKIQSVLLLFWLVAVAGVTPARADELATIEYNDPLTHDHKTSLKLTQDDVLWAARMIDTEGGGGDDEHAAAAIWTVVQRSWCHTANRHSTFTASLREFSQPINPIWNCAESGTACRNFCDESDGKGGCKTRHNYCDATADNYLDPASVSKGHYCAAHRLRERRTITSTPLEKLSPVAQRVAKLFAEGKLPNPIPGATDWQADCGNDRSPRTSLKAWSYSDNSGFTEGCGGTNTFYFEKCDAHPERFSNFWSGEEVRLKAPDGKLSAYGRSELAMAAVVRTLVASVKKAEANAEKIAERYSAKSVKLVHELTNGSDEGLAGKTSAY
ncbi:MAG: hypothetical protein HY075_04220 [Deltaproteobacteria bacterium]|nr:hypothetical protein [Deltaproteobacteria bacterium]